MTNAIILVSGSELTRGETRDRNGPYLATELSLLGVRVDEISLLPDEPKILAAGLKRAMSLADVVIISGGLGPTADDHTVETLAEVFGRDVVRDPEAEARLQKLAEKRRRSLGKIPSNFFKQADVLAGSRVLLNPVGLAPGMAIDTERGFLVVFPGVPRELTAMYRELVVPLLQERFSLVPPRIVRAKIMGLGESWVEERIQKLPVDFGSIEYGISASPGEILVKFISRRREDHASLDRVRELLEREFGKNLIVLREGLQDAKGEAIATGHSSILNGLLREKGVTVATAESCTGGLIARRLTDHPGSSDYFLGSVVAYHDRTKEKLLGIPAELLSKHGAVSEEVCRAMASAARRIFGADFGIADTGIAGPGGGTEEKPVGLVYLGIASFNRSTGEEEVLVERRTFWGDRGHVRRLAVVGAMELLRQSL